VIYYNSDAEPVSPEVSFGPKDHQKMTLEWAEAGLMWLFAHRRQVFGAMLLAINECEPEAKTRARRGDREP